MTLTEVKALVIRTTDLSESDRLIRLYSDRFGIVSAYANNSRSLKSRYMAAAQLFCYGNYVLYQKGDKFWVREVELENNFFGLRASITKTALGSYFCDVLSEAGTTDPDVSLLRLILNCLYALEKDLAPEAKIKLCFEMRCAAALGFMPDLSGCSECGNDEGELYLDVLGGTCTCKDCREYAASVRQEGMVITEGEEERRPVLILSPGVRAALRYVMECPIERIFSFRVSDADESALSVAAEQYLLHHLERGFDTLKFYKEVSG